VTAEVARLMAPASVAVIGASEDQTKFGGRLYRMLLKHGYAGAVYPINPNRSALFGLKAYPDLASTPAPAELAVMAVPRPMVAPMVETCARIGVRGAIIITSKFSDEGPEGAAIEQAIVRTGRAAGMRIIGPNCLGLISPANKVVLCSSPALDIEVLPVGAIGFVSQSGAMMATLFDRARGRGVGFSHCVSVGNQADLEFCDFVDYCIDDPNTAVICGYLEGLKNPSRFVECARKARAAGKPFLIVKAGRTEGGVAAAFSHTASLAGSFAALEAVCRETGTLLMDDFDAMLLLASALVQHRGRRVSSAVIITTSGGGGAVAADRLAAVSVPLTRLAPATEMAFAEHYSPGQARNPIDLGGRLAGGEAIDIADTTMAIVARDPAEKVALSYLTTSPAMSETAGKLADVAMAADQPALFVMAAGPAAEASRAELVRRGVPFTDSLDEAVRSLRGWVEFSAYAPLAPPVRPAGIVPAVEVSAGVLHPRDVARLFAAYSLPMVAQEICDTDAASMAAVARLGWPVALKAIGPAIVHKTEAGAVALGLASAEALTAAMQAMRARLPGVAEWLVQRMAAGKTELLLGVRNDAQFGPLLVVGAGGVLVELLQDIATARAPVSSATARAMLQRLKVGTLLRGVRGKPPLDIDAVVDVMVRLSWLAHDLQARLQELDINPLLVRWNGATIVDARVMVGEEI
jgi:acetyl-CoA synthetase (ADP-forming)